MRWALSLALLVLAAGCSSGRRVDSPAVVSASGRIGPLHVDRSTRADVIAFAGRPDAERKGGEGGGAPPFRALGYGCSGKASLHLFPLLEDSRGRRGPYCQTVFWINERTKRLGNFFTASSRFVESHGVRIGMRSQHAERLLHKRLTAGCEENLYFENRSAMLTVAFAGGVTHLERLPGSNLKAAGHVTGAHVFSFTLHGRKSEVGIFDCL
jgi:hypothetical protein